MATEGKFRIHAKGYPERFHGQEIAFVQGETMAEAIAMGHAENETALVRAFYNQRNIKASDSIKDLAGKPETTLATFAEILRTYKVMAERKSGGGAPKTEEQKRAAKEKRDADKAKLESIANLETKRNEDPEIAALLAKLAKKGVSF